MHHSDYIFIRILISRITKIFELYKLFIMILILVYLVPREYIVFIFLICCKSFFVCILEISKKILLIVIVKFFESLL